MNRKAKKYLGLSYLPVALIFLFNPDIAVIDLLPDCIGYLIMCSALTDLADMNYYFADACVLFKKAALISLGRLLSIFLIFGLFGIQEQSVSILLFCFVFGVLDLIVLIPAYKKLFEGFLYAAERCNGSAVYEYRFAIKKQADGKKTKKKRTPRKNITARAFSRSVAFVTVKVLCSTLPEFTTLADNQEYEFLSLLRSAAFIVALGMGIAWMIYTLRYISALKRDSVFICCLTEKYNKEIAPKTGIFISRRLCAALSLASVALLLSVDIYSDYINLLPDMLSPTLLFVFFAMIRKYFKKYKVGMILSALTFVSSSAEWMQSLRFYNEFYPGAVSKNYQAYVEYYIMFRLAIAKAVTTLCLIGFTFYVIYKLACRHTGILRSSNNRETEHDNSKSDECKEIKLKFSVYFVIAVLSAFATLFNIWAQPMNINNWFLETAPMIDITVGLLFSVFSVSLIYDIKKEIRSKYLFD